MLINGFIDAILISQIVNPYLQISVELVFVQICLQVTVDAHMTFVSFTVQTQLLTH